MDLKCSINHIPELGLVYFRAHAELSYMLNNLFDAYSLNELIKKYSLKELKEFITVYYVVGKDFINRDYTETSKVYEISDSLFNKIQVFYSPYVEEDYIRTGFKDSRKDNSISSECYIPYINFN